MYLLAINRIIKRNKLKNNIKESTRLITSWDVRMKNRPNITTLKICTGIIIIDNTLKEISSKAAADKETKVAQRILYNLSDKIKFNLLIKKGDDLKNIFLRAPILGRLK